jgi:chromosome segregation ATPase
MVERSSAIPAWAWIVGAVLAIGIVFTGYRTVQTQRHLETVQSELDSAKQAADQARAQTADMEKQRNELQTKLDEATSGVKSVQSELESTQSRLEAMQSELNSSKQAADQARAQTADLEKRAATINSDLEKASVERNELQAEILRLKGELEQATRSQSP